MQHIPLLLLMQVETVAEEAKGWGEWAERAGIIAILTVLLVLGVFMLVWLLKRQEKNYAEDVDSKRVTIDRLAKQLETATAGRLTDAQATTELRTAEVVRFEAALQQAAAVMEKVVNQQVENRALVATSVNDVSDSVRDLRNMTDGIRQEWRDMRNSLDRLRESLDRRNDEGRTSG